ncbi:Hypothetical predicted protein, partial [Pelobates cultripes]
GLICPQPSRAGGSGAQRESQVLSGRIAVRLQLHELHKKGTRWKIEETVWSHLRSHFKVIKSSSVV